MIGWNVFWNFAVQFYIFYIYIYMDLNSIIHALKVSQDTATGNFCLSLRLQVGRKRFIVTGSNNMVKYRLLLVCWTGYRLHEVVTKPNRNNLWSWRGLWYYPHFAATIFGSCVLPNRSPRVAPSNTCLNLFHVFIFFICACRLFFIFRVSSAAWTNCSSV